MRTLTIIRVPGDGATTVSVPESVTWRDLVRNYMLEGRSIFGNGDPVGVESYDQQIPAHIVDVYATVTVKGN